MRKKYLIAILPIVIMIISLFGCSNFLKKRAGMPEDSNIKFDKAPVLVLNEEPRYPAHAFRDGITGVVWVKAFVNDSGYVTDAVIEKDSGQKAGFEECAIEAALKCKWKPALVDDKPIGVWVTYKVEFAIREHSNLNAQ